MRTCHLSMEPRAISISDRPAQSTDMMISVAPIVVLMTPPLATSDWLGPGLHGASLLKGDPTWARAPPTLPLPAFLSLGGLCAHS